MLQKNSCVHFGSDLHNEHELKRIWQLDKTILLNQFPADRFSH